MSGIYQFEFKKHVSSDGINDALNLSVLNVRNIVGKPKVQLDASYGFGFVDADVKQFASLGISWQLLNKNINK